MSPVGFMRSKSGCRTCRTRRVKCGEERPECRRCSSTGRKCDYVVLTGLHPAPRAYSVETSPVQRERRAFEYYYYRVAPTLSDALDLAFWRGAVLQISRSEPAVWDAVVALSTFYRSPVDLQTGAGLHQSLGQRFHPRTRSQQEGLGWYSRSLASIQSRILGGKVDLAVALVSCVLFVSIEILQGNVQAVMALYRQGVQLILSASAARLEDFIPLGLAASVFERLGPLAQMMGGFSYLPDHSTTLVNVRDVHVSLGAARDTLYALVTEWKKLDDDWKSVRHDAEMRQAPGLGDKFRSRQSSLEHKFVAWYQRFESMDEVVQYIDGSDPNSGPALHDGIIASLLTTYTAFLLSTRTCLSLGESVYDAYESEFAQIVAHAPVALAATATGDGDQPPFVFDMGVAMPLFVTVLKCRIPSLRRRALELQLRGPPRQSLYVGASAAQLLAALIVLEETGNFTSEIRPTELWSRPGCVPSEDNRVVDFSLVPAEALTHSHIQCSRWCGTGEERRLVYQVVTLCSEGLTPPT